MKKRAKKIKEDNTQILIKQQAQRIEELRKENHTLTETLDGYRKTEKEIVNTLSFAKQKGEEYVAMIKVKYAVECERLALFRAKLKTYRNKEELVKNFDDGYQQLQQLQNDLESTLAKDFGNPIRDFMSEKKRLGDDATTLNYGAIIEKSDLATAPKITEQELKELLEQL